MSDPLTKYARPERERRFVLAAVPGDATDAREIVDRYVIGSRLRVRSVTTAAGTTHKLGHKVRPDPDDPGLVMHTSMYLSPAEFEVLAALPANVLQKTRRSLRHGRPVMSVDEFHDVLAGLITAEVDFPDDTQMRAFVPPDLCVAEVSRDERFTGGRLATTSRAELARALEAINSLHLPS